MSWPMGIIGDKLVVHETWSGTRGGTYCYMVVSNKLVHVSRRGEQRLEGVSRAGRRRDYVYELSLDALCRDRERVEFIVFSFTNSGGGPYPSKYVLDCISKTVVEEDISIDQVLGYEVEVLNPRTIYELKIYDGYVIPMIKEINSIKKELGFDIRFRRSPRFSDTLEKPEISRLIGLILPNWQARKKYLEVIIRTVHEIYVMVLIPYALNAKTVGYGDYKGETYWYIELASEFSTAIIETPSGKKYTLWYQFSPRDWWNVVFPNWYAAMVGSTPKTPRQFIRPDIMVFEGAYRYRNELLENPPKRAWLIEAKTKITDSDLDQLRGYIESFKDIAINKLTPIIVGLERIPYKEYLEIIGYKVFEYVAPNSKGVQQYIEYIRKTMQ
ncbi:MAG: hypothetical protein B6U89_05715 [Desulfurococcales archaeon ex4484_58]|nr:MAG: hypothetical protein B6U89_05715 [Desulfurococcales archaeon ex4484_58]